MSSVAVGHFLTMKSGTTNQIEHNYQNFFVGEDVTYESATYVFLPFGFSGVTVNRTGDGTDEALFFLTIQKQEAMANSAEDGQI